MNNRHNLTREQEQAEAAARHKAAQLPPPAPTSAPHYRYETTGNGFTAEIFSPSGESIAFMQGEEAGQFLDECEAIGKQTFPSGPFNTAEDLLDYLMGLYEPG
jgi:hypothetical protein